MDTLDDRTLLAALEEAIKLNLDQEFIEILKRQLRARGLEKAAG